MKINFKSRLEAIDWIANFAEDEGKFEVLRKQLSFNFIYTGNHFLEHFEKTCEVVWMRQNKFKTKK